MQDGNDMWVPPEIEPGVYAHHLWAWHTAHEFTLDFAVSRSTGGSDPELDVPLAVSRVRIPVTFIFDVIMTINAEMTKYEADYGEIERPRQRGSGETDAA